MNVGESSTSKTLRPWGEGGFFKAFLAILLVGNLFGLWLGIWHKPELLLRSPKLEPIWAIYFACPLLSIIAIFAMWRWRKWGLWCAILVGLVVFGIESYSNPFALHTFRVPLAMTLLLLSARAHWKRFK